MHRGKMKRVGALVAGLWLSLAGCGSDQPTEPGSTATVPQQATPAASAGADQGVDLGTLVRLDGTGSRGDSLVYHWHAPEGITLEGAATATPTFVASAAGRLQFVLVVSSRGVNSLPDTVVVMVEEPFDGTAHLPNGVTMEFVWVGPGAFTMGDADLGDTPHQVTVTRGYWLGLHEVTQGQWQALTATAPWLGQNGVQENASHPAVYLSWEDVQALVQSLNYAAGEAIYRLPTEAEWEYACRAGTTTEWSFGGSESQLTKYAWYDANAAKAGQRYAHAVAAKLPNPRGLYDMHGNVWEWVQDWYAGYADAAQTDPSGPVTGSYRVFRGGSFSYGAPGTRSAFRYSGEPSGRYDDVGARLLRTR